MVGWDECLRLSPFPHHPLRFTPNDDERIPSGDTHVEEILAGHAWLSWDTGWDDDDVGALEGLCEAIVVWAVALGDGGGVDVGEVCTEVI